jgi:hypothetical protein
MGGNAFEWNEALISGSSRLLRGGSSDNVSFFMLSSVRGASQDPSFENYSYGFRVASVPEPSTLVLAALGFVGGLLGWRRRKRDA